jgi:hypothetical protein
MESNDVAAGVATVTTGMSMIGIGMVVMGIAE